MVVYFYSYIFYTIIKIFWQDRIVFNQMQYYKEHSKIYYYLAELNEWQFKNWRCSLLFLSFKSFFIRLLLPPLPPLFIQPLRGFEGGTSTNPPTPSTIIEFIHQPVNHLKTVCIWQNNINSDFRFFVNLP